MLFRYEYHGGVWVDLEHPTEDEVRRIAQEFSIGERLEMELFSPTPSSLVANDDGMTFMVLNFPAHGASDGEINDQEIDFVVSKKFIVTPARSMAARSFFCPSIHFSTRPYEPYREPSHAHRKRYVQWP